MTGEVHEGWIQGCISYCSLKAAVIYALTAWVSCYAILKKPYRRTASVTLMYVLVLEIFHIKETVWTQTFETCSSQCGSCPVSVRKSNNIKGIVIFHILTWIWMSWRIFQGCFIAYLSGFRYIDESENCGFSWCLYIVLCSCPLWNHLVTLLKESNKMDVNGICLNNDYFDLHGFLCYKSEKSLAAHSIQNVKDQTMLPFWHEPYNNIYALKHCFLRRKYSAWLFDY